jgi:hypothetical protein
VRLRVRGQLRGAAPVALTADAALLAGIDSVTADERAAFSLAMGPMNLDFDAFAGMRLNEHAFHTWDIEFAVDPAATIPEQVAALSEIGRGPVALLTVPPDPRQHHAPPSNSAARQVDPQLPQPDHTPTYSRRPTRNRWQRVTNCRPRARRAGRAAFKAMMVSERSPPPSWQSKMSPGPAASSLAVM